MEVAIGEDDKAAVLRAGILAGLLLADERVLIFGFGFEDDEREAAVAQQQEVNEAFACLLEVLAKCIQIGSFDRYAGFETNIGGELPSAKKRQPAA